MMKVETAGHSDNISNEMYTALAIEGHLICINRAMGMIPKKDTGLGLKV
jgi:hypothetical protein